ncbi:MAG: prepilin-type N-terminal cleavage/methylation domain-containing protein [Fimbriimonas sp.]
MNRKGAFTLIELLVVIAIIAILAAILFPVFAQAKAAAKATQSLSNTKQIGTAQQMYLADNDDVYPIRRYCLQTSPQTVYSWKQALFPYNKSTDMWIDPVNPAGKFLDDTSDDAILASRGQMLTRDSKLPRFGRGYAMANLGFYINGAWDNDACNVNAPTHNAYSATAIEQPAAVASLWEHKRDWVDTGSYIDWTKNYPDPDGVQRGQGWSWGGGKWGEKAMTLVYMDNHAKRTAHSAICGTPRENYNAFGWIRNNLTNMAPGGDMSWLDTYCQTMPQEVK